MHEMGSVKAKDAWTDEALSLKATGSHSTRSFTGAISFFPVLPVDLLIDEALLLQTGEQLFGRDSLHP